MYSIYKYLFIDSFVYVFIFIRYTHIHIDLARYSFGLSSSIRCHFSWKSYNFCREAAMQRGGILWSAEYMVSKKARAAQLSNCSPGISKWFVYSLLHLLRHRSHPPPQCHVAGGLEHKNNFHLPLILKQILDRRPDSE